MTHPGLPNEPIDAFLDDETLEHEFLLFADYLLSAKPDERYIERYQTACRTHLFETAPSRALVFASSRPWSLCFLEAACRLVAPRDELCKKLLIASAVLEAGPDYADEFLPRHVGLPMMVLSVIGHSFTAGIKALVGFGILLWIGERPFADLRGTESSG